MSGLEPAGAAVQPPRWATTSPFPLDDPAAAAPVPLPLPTWAVGGAVAAGSSMLGLAAIVAARRGAGSLVARALPAAGGLASAIAGGRPGPGVATVLRSAGVATLGGAVAGAAIVGLDRATGGELGLHVPLREGLAALRHAAEVPMLGPLARAAMREAGEDSVRRFGAQPDGPMDAWNHAAFTATLTLRLMRDHGIERAAAREMVRDIGRAHEDAATSDLANARRRMDLHNNEAGIAAVADGRSPDGRWLRDDEVAPLLLAAMRAGALRVADVDATRPALRPTGAVDLPQGS